MEYTELNNVCNIISRGKSVLKSNTGTIIYVGFKDIENNTINFETTAKCKLVNEYNAMVEYYKQNGGSNIDLSQYKTINPIKK